MSVPPPSSALFQSILKVTKPVRHELEALAAAGQHGLEVVGSALDDR